MNYPAFKLDPIPIPLRQDEGGTYRVGNSRVTLDSIWHAWRKASTVDEVAEAFPTLHLADICAVVTFLLQYEDEVAQYMALRREEADRLQAEVQSRQKDSEVVARLRALRATRSDPND